MKCNFCNHDLVLMIKFIGEKFYYITKKKRQGRLLGDETEEDPMFHNLYCSKCDSYYYLYYGKNELLIKGEAYAGPAKYKMDMRGQQE